MILCLIHDFLNYQPLPELMQGAGIAVLTLLISFALGIFIHHLGDSELRKNSLDLHVALDYVWQFKFSVKLLLIVVLSPFLMSIDNLLIQLLVFITWSVCLYFLLQVNFRLYEWVKGDKDTFRKKYLADFPKSPRDTIISWSDFWAEDRNSKKGFAEPSFFEVFSNQVDVLLKSESKSDWETLVKLLDGFVAGIDNRSKIFLLIFPEFFPKVLEWHFILWKRQYSQYAKDLPAKDKKVDVDAFQVDDLIDRLIKYQTKEALLGGTRHAHSYFKCFADHVEKYKDEFIEGNEFNYLYVEQLPIYTDWFEMITQSQESYDIWNHYFPASWKVTISNLQNNKISNVWLQRFIDWSQSRLWKDDNAWDKNLEEISRELFPDVDPITWAKLYTFIMRPWSSSRVQSYLEKKVNFGYSGRVYIGDTDDGNTGYTNAFEAQVQSSIDLALHLFGSQFTAHNLDLWIKELETIQYPEDSDEFRKKGALLWLFNLLRKRVIENENLNKN